MSPISGSDLQIDDDDTEDEDDEEEEEVKPLKSGSDAARDEDDEEDDAKAGIVLNCIRHIPQGCGSFGSLRTFLRLFIVGVSSLWLSLGCFFFQGNPGWGTAFPKFDHSFNFLRVIGSPKAAPRKYGYGLVNQSINRSTDWGSNQLIDRSTNPGLISRLIDRSNTILGCQLNNRLIDLV